MRLTTPWMVVLLLSVASTALTEDSSSVSLKEVGVTTENGPPTSSMSTEKFPSTTNGVPIKDTVRSLNSRQNDVNDLTPTKDVIGDDLVFFESLLNGEKIKKENQKNTVFNRHSRIEKSHKFDDNSESPVESKIFRDLIDIRRQGELKPNTKPGKSDPDIPFDDSKQAVLREPRTQFGLRKLRQSVQDRAPVLQLTQGGYNRPFRQPRFRNRYISRADSSEQSAQVQELGRSVNGNRIPETRRVVPQVAYSNSPPVQQFQTFESRPVLNPGFEAPRNMFAVHHVVPTTIQNTFFNPPSTGLNEFTTLPFQAQFPQNNEVGGFPNFGRDTNNAALYQVSQRNPFQTPTIMFQSAPEVQTQPVIADHARNLPPQFRANPFAPYSGYENAEDSSRPNFAMYFRNPTVNNQFEIPSNFYAPPQNTVNAFNSPPISFLSNYPSSDNNLSSRFFRYPVTTEAQINRQSSNDQQPNSSREDKNTNVEEQEAVTPTNRDDKPTNQPFGARLQSESEANVYMRYPTSEAGYATEESLNLPSQNTTGEEKDNTQTANLGQRSFPVDDPFRNGLNAIHTNQRINGSYEFPPELFGNVPLEFGYHRPQNQIFLQYPDRNRENPRYPGPNFGSGSPFGPVVTLPENNYQFLNVNNQRQRQWNSDAVPSCAKQNNASICFEDSEYPKNDILYSLNSNSFLADRLSGPEMLLKSIVLVERNANVSDETSEKYACSVEITLGTPLRAKNIAGAWRIIINVGKISQPVRMEVCKSLGDPCSYADSQTKTTCVQKYSLQRLLTWGPGKGIYSDVYKIPVACSCQILDKVEP